MTLSNSRQQFLAYETQGPEDIHYGRKGGIFVTTCICVGFMISAVILAGLVGIIVYYITYFKLSQKPQDFWDETEPFGQASASPDLRLPSDVLPSFYRLKLIADLENSSFTGDVYITIRANKKVKEIILHSKNLNILSNAKLTEQIYEKVATLNVRKKRQAVINETSEATNAVNNSTAPVISENATERTSNEPEATTPSIGTSNTTETTNTNTEPNKTSTISTTTLAPDTQTQVTHSTVRNIKILSITSAPGDRLVLTLASSLKTDVDYTLELSFRGEISNAMTGFYKSTYTTDKQEVRNIGVTQFEATYARAAFPCFDEPEFKAKFEISIAHRNNITAISNMKVATEEDMSDKPGWKWTHFERSVKMSTYLVAYVLSDFKFQETSYLSKDNITKPIRIWTKPDLIANAKYAVTVTPKILEFYEELFGVPYALDKIDLVAVPDFASGAMENWGLITFRETTLLFDEATNVPRDKLGVAVDIAHELAHQWFGNLVTMRWWTDLWLNEGFATYVEYVGVDHIEPGWNMMESFSRDKMSLLRTDALKNTSPVSRQVVDASEIAQKFDEISYMKGANLIRMLNHTISEELFRKGLVYYLNQWKYANAEENDLWQAMSSASRGDPSLSGHSLVELMNSWTRQAGYPALTVTRDYSTGDVRFEQKLFSSSSNPYKSMLDQLWQIPISYTTVDVPVHQWSTRPRLWLTEKTTSVKIPLNNSQAFYVNVGAIGYYRVNYDQRNWELLQKALQSKQVESTITRAQLIDDAFNLAKSGQLNYSYALGLTTYMIDGEDTRTVWDSLLQNLNFLRLNLKATSGYTYFQDFVGILLKKQLEKYNYGLKKPKDDNEAFLVDNLVLWECYIESPRCINWARDSLDQWMNQTDITQNPIPSYLRHIAYTAAAKHGTRRQFDFLYNVFLTSTDPSVKATVLSSLPYTRDEGLLVRLLEQSLDGLPKQYASVVWDAESPVGTTVAQRFLIDHFSTIYAKFTAMDPFIFSTVLTGAFGLITTEQELDTLKSFALEHKDLLTPMSQTLQKLVDLGTMRVQWIKRHAGEITDWFRDYINSTKNPTVPATVPTPVQSTTVTNTSNTTENTLTTTDAIVPDPTSENTTASP